MDGSLRAWPSERSAASSSDERQHHGAVPTFTKSISQMFSAGTLAQEEALSTVDHFRSSINPAPNRGDDDGKAGPFINRWWFSLVVSTTIAINSVQMGLECEFPELLLVWKVMENCVTLIFVIELGCKLYFLRLEFFACSWHWLDFVLTMFAVIDTWVLCFVESSFDKNTLAVLRIISLLRLLRILKLLQRFRKFVIVVAGIVDAVKLCMWVGMVLAMAIYSFAIFNVRLIGQVGADTYPGYTTEATEIEESLREFNPYLSFGSMPRAMLTLLNMTLLEGWGEVSRAVMMYQPWLLPAFIFFVLFVTLGIMNVIIGMICDGVLTKAQEMKMGDQKKVRNKKLQLLDRLHDLLTKLDLNGDGKIDAEELKKAIQANPEVAELIESADLPEGLSAEELVNLLDTEGDGWLSYDNFIRSFYRLIDGCDFHQLCIMQMNINTMKGHVVDIKKHAMDSQALFCAKLQELEERLLDSSKAVMTMQRHQEPALSAATSAALQQPGADESSEPPEDEDEDDESDEVDRCDHWRHTVVDPEDATSSTEASVQAEGVCVSAMPSGKLCLDSPEDATSSTEASLQAEGVCVSAMPSGKLCLDSPEDATSSIEASLQAEGVCVSALPSGKLCLDSNAAQTDAQLPSRTQVGSDSPSVSQWQAKVIRDRGPFCSTRQATFEQKPKIQECQHTIL